MGLSTPSASLGAQLTLDLINLSADDVHPELGYDVRADLLADRQYSPAGADVGLGGYGYRWLRVMR